VTFCTFIIIKIGQSFTELFYSKNKMARFMVHSVSLLNACCPYNCTAIHRNHALLNLS